MFVFENNNVIDTRNNTVVNEGETFISANEIAFSSIDDVIENVILKIKLYNKAESEELVSQYTQVCADKKEELSVATDEFASLDNKAADESLSKIEQLKQQLKLTSFETKIKRLNFEISDLQKKEEIELKEKALNYKIKRDGYRKTLEQLILSSEDVIETNLKGSRRENLMNGSVDLAKYGNSPLRSMPSISVDSSLDKSFDKKIKLIRDELNYLDRSFDFVGNKVHNLSEEWQEVRNYAEIYLEEFNIFSKLSDGIIDIFLERKNFNDVTRRRTEETELSTEREASKERLENIDSILNELIRELIRTKLEESELIAPGFLHSSKYFIS